MRNLAYIIQAIIIVMLMPKMEGRTVNLGVLIPYSGSRSMGEEVTTAVNMAINKVNNDTSLRYLRENNITLTYVAADTKCEIGTGLFQLVQMAPDVDVFIGPACDPLCQPAGLLAGKWNKPMISYSCASKSLTAEDLFTTMVRVSPLYDDIANFVVDIVKHFNWKSVSLVEGSEVIWRETVSHYQQVLEDNGVNADIFALPEDYHHETLKKHLLDSAEENRIFILCAYGTDILNILCALEKAGLLNGEYAFIAVDFAFMTSSTLDSSLCNMDRYINGLLDITIEINEGYKDYENFLVELLNSTENTAYKGYAIGIHAGMLYDAVYLYALGLNTALAEGKSIYDGVAIIDSIKNHTFHGVTGDVIIDHRGSRKSHFMLHNVFQGWYTSVAHSNGSLGGTEFYPGVNIIWHGGSTVIPADHPPCGWQGEFCKEMNDMMPLYISIGVLLVLVMVMSGAVIFYWYRKKAYQEKMESMSWKITYTQLTFKVVSKTNNSLATSRVNLNVTFNTNKSSRSFETLSGRQSFDSAISHMGQLFTKIASYRDQTLAVKAIQKPYVAITPALIQEINQVRNLQHRNINSLIGACVDPFKISILSTYCVKGSLQDVLENDDIKLDHIFKVSFASDIAKGMSYIHSSSVKCHGRLKSSNVFVDRHWSCKVGDIYMPVFREGERNNTPGDRKQVYQLLWTSPELLRNEDLYPRGTQKGDVYAYAIILQEIILRMGPYGMMNLEPEDIVNSVRIKQSPPFRPRVIEEDGETLLCDLMRMCWEELPLFRPSFPTVLETLKKDNHGRTANLVDQMVHMMSKYADHLEDLVTERTEQLEAEQKRTEDLLCRMLPRSIANELKVGNHVIPETFESVTVCFSDIVGFTVLSSSSTPMEVVNFLNDLYTCFDRIIENFEVYKVETIGDAYMVVSGMPVRNDHHAGEVATMALNLLSSVTTFRMRHKPDKQIQLRIGIHSGPVAAGVVGLKMPRYCLFGDTVNYASRMESSGLALRIHVSPECKDKLEEIGGFFFECRGLVSMKGKGSIQTYFLLGREGFNKPLPDLSQAAPLEEHTFK